MNSTAVIIGAMLISPLMGPIVGAGVSLGVNDLDLFKKSVRNLIQATGFGIAASTFYFLLSPLSAAQSELLARTQPTIYDVLIAICGGATGIIANSRREKSFNAVSGVAIATALMPPLCTVGYGISQGKPSYFIGAFYLYLINATFICLASFAFVKLVGFKPHVYLNTQIKKKVTRIMTAIIVIVVVPSLYTGYQMVNDVFFQSEATRFIAEQFKFSDTKIVEKTIGKTEGKPSIEITLIGRPLTKKQKDVIYDALEHSKLRGTLLNLRHLSVQERQEELLQENPPLEFKMF